ncbi:hypothetical protein PUNSTDRAFT_137534 [Punctularia strigosozonata HHB-11173 SS5]|uniref:uncharacterized protein n=1 Tax=Punctularia strigosozonata (strain HHB-11173) TaxID=741275 RepID=UPI0004416F4A|nr:uncharacterized protein PUNSTDRAFT_137534 [Punctularia strigosozonata HHB-11173 SS5]EIN05423.1 hypothetical protein PUNSTDRAFT_137534 [Punctularia strigosozonata HHB-11173 SS5]
MQLKIASIILASAAVAFAVPNPQADTTITTNTALETLRTFTMTRVRNTVLQHAPYLTQTTEIITYTQSAPIPTSTSA